MLPLRSTIMTRVFILGAGFSKAINADMPLLGGLRNGVESILNSWKIDIGRDLDAIADVERWLTVLADQAPWLSRAEQMRNLALFDNVSRAIYEVLTTRQTRAAISSAPDWLIPLITYWHRSRETVITFNYDCLVELAYMDAMVGEDGGGMPSDLYGIPITPAALRVAPIYARKKVWTFKLLKLHGSLSWWYSGMDAERSDSIYEMIWTGSFGKGIEQAHGELGGDLLVTDKLPMIVPPAATKTPFYRNSLLAAQWVQAAEALREADELVIMGYSAPVTDLSVTSLIATQFRGSAIVPVNLDATMADHAKELGDRRNPPQVVEEFVGLSSLEKWTNTFAH
jgi:NAD-dependent SIR2 family protein deacetylase